MTAYRVHGYCLVPCEAEFSGGRIIVFSHGWAIDIWAFGKAHYYRLDAAQNARAICGHSTIHTSQLWGAGTVPRCKMCSKKARSK